MNSLLDMEETFCQQRARADWLKDGSRNTKFSLARATARRWEKKKKSIRVLLNDQGV